MTHCERVLDLNSELGVDQFRPILFAQTPEELRFFTKVRELPNGCWEWVACSQGGYGKFAVEGVPRQAHRVSYRWFFGDEALGDLHVDHQCRNTLCVNPTHLEAVTQAENNRRAHLGRPKPRRSHCRKNHPLTGGNAGVRSDGKGIYCRECSRASSRRYAARRADA